MSRLDHLEHEFVEFIPEDPSYGVIYISIPFATTVHLCCCGCGREVAAPLTPTDWKLTFNGDSVSLSPSIGNWNYECQSHYIIQRNRVIWSTEWTRERIERGRATDMANKSLYYGEKRGRVSTATPEATLLPSRGVLRRFAELLRGFRRR